jgi:hypothetical protein
MPGEGFEPPTFGLQNRCTTTVLTRQYVVSALCITQRVDAKLNVFVEHVQPGPQFRGNVAKSRSHRPATSQGCGIDRGTGDRQAIRMTLRLIVTDLTGIVFAAFLSALEAGLAYVNTHDATFPGGAQWFSRAVPEPSVIGVLGRDLRLSHSLR